MLKLQVNHTVAVVGASANQDKYGYKVLNTLKVKGVKVYPVNPNADCIGGLKVWPDLASLPVKPDIISIIVPPAVSLRIVDQIIKLKYDNVWFQPGSFDEAVLAKAKSAGLNYEAKACILVAAGEL
ncbi:TPA: CoA-binding protein [Candidatus Falkowbacteria bacterium]|nr:CoA-binding protein [Candidatus Falkowbacteria bacterium]